MDKHMENEMETLYYVEIYRDYMVVSMGCLQISVLRSVPMLGGLPV